MCDRELVFCSPSRNIWCLWGCEKNACCAPYFKKSHRTELEYRRLREKYPAAARQAIMTFNARIRYETGNSSYRFQEEIILSTELKLLLILQNTWIWWYSRICATRYKISQEKRKKIQRNVKEILFFFQYFQKKSVNFFSSIFFGNLDFTSHIEWACKIFVGLGPLVWP